MNRDGKDMPDYPEYYIMCRRDLHRQRRAYMLNTGSKEGYLMSLLDMMTAINAFTAEPSLPESWAKSQESMKARLMDEYCRLSRVVRATMKGGG